MLDKNFLELFRKLVDYVNGNCLVFSVYGEELKGKILLEIESVVGKFELCFFNKIFNVLKISYDVFSDREKEIFL